MKKRRRQERNEAFAMYRKKVRLMPLPVATDQKADARLTSVAQQIIGQIMSVQDVIRVLVMVGTGHKFYNSLACTCGKPNCLNLPYHTIGYVAGFREDESGRVHGDHHDLIRYEEVTGA